LFSDKGNTGKKLPTIVLAHGWGGVQASLRPEAAAFAQAGYLALTFDYRGWGTSDSKVVLAGKRMPSEVKNWRFTAEVQAVREVVDPSDMVTDWLNAIAFVVAEPQGDKDRLGLWGSSLSGGLVLSAAERDPRVKAIHTQVPGMQGWWAAATPAARAVIETETTQRARGELGFPEPGARSGSLRGRPILFQFANWSPVDDVERIPRVAIEVIVAEKDELLDNKDHGYLVYQRAKGPKYYEVIPNITHYGVYNIPEVRSHVRDLALKWFDQYVKNISGTR
jgi:alpha-beta hydrolase superfamily lysophospholipase